ncbi:MoaF-related domain-containing protein [Formosa algae]|uniref:MoaF-like domain-containing protein n=1 Tax=Formosa algae TaxID=225843 RepID=A0A9X0YPA1_9FLAO|nr:hypothetical protein [Formosa algae]MBP1841139.1 hypothetical protein [Formosa algae]MDQ0336441.1 hypothetical protein [Formosa algae]OEI81404.1 hypothetical protein AST99_03985 [Formosa algae]
MKTKFITLMCLAVLGLGQVFAQNQTEHTAFKFGEAEHFLDGYSFNFQYQDGKALHMSFSDGKAEYEWILGPKKGNGNTNIPYRSRKLSEHSYLINWHETGKKDYLTLVVDFEKMIVHSSIIVGYENQPERPLKTVFLTGIIDHLKQD